ncbi:hypothetical protein KTO58_09520 [Chitinophaga pendula]|uniref:hypothetical protein n=1 Tax=Chitinophaga TaxID=79328 RepID=UPI000BB03E92|nr:MULTISPECIES: hypothetical protein [Chitinophaga]ASZ12965.1 hypothetical protein CK934_19380 [Chitinophaga sp. MD30]UCJ09402.1 hypothetical protein KTO58_09520 [Chitinophaga pendula]
MTKYLLAGVIVPATVLVPLGAAVYKRRYEHPVSRAMFAYVVLSGLTNVIARVLGSYGVNNLWVLHIYTLLECIILLYYYQLLFRNRTITRLTIWGMILFTLLCVVNFFFIQYGNRFNSYTRSLSAVFFITFSAGYFLQQSGKSQTSAWWESEANWINTGILIYYGSALALFAFANLLYQTATVKQQLLVGNIHATLVMVAYLLFAAGFWYGKDRR